MYRFENLVHSLQLNSQNEPTCIAASLNDGALGVLSRRWSERGNDGWDKFQSVPGGLVQLYYPFTQSGAIHFMESDLGTDDLQRFSLFRSVPAQNTIELQYSKRNIDNTFTGPVTVHSIPTNTNKFYDSSWTSLLSMIVDAQNVSHIVWRETYTEFVGSSPFPRYSKLFYRAVGSNDVPIGTVQEIASFQGNTLVDTDRFYEAELQTDASGVLHLGVGYKEVGGANYTAYTYLNQGSWEALTTLNAKATGRFDLFKIGITENAAEQQQVRFYIASENALYVSSNNGNTWQEEAWPVVLSGDEYIIDMDVDSQNRLYFIIGEVLGLNGVTESTSFYRRNGFESYTLLELPQPATDVEIGPGDTFHFARLNLSLLGTTTAYYFRTYEDNLGYQDSAAMLGVTDSLAVNLSNGNAVGMIPLTSARGRGIPASLSLFYNSAGVEDLSLSEGWRLSLQTSLTFQREYFVDGGGFRPYVGRMTLTLGDGSSIVFEDPNYDTYHGKNPAFPPNQVFLFARQEYGFFSRAEIITQDQEGSFPAKFVSVKLRNKYGDIYEYDGNSGKLKKITDTNGNTLELFYGDNPLTSTRVEGNLISIIDSSQREIILSYDAQNRLESVIDPGNSEFQFAYDANSRRLQNLIFPEVDSELQTDVQPTYAFSYFDKNATEFSVDGQLLGRLSEIRNPERNDLDEDGTRIKYRPGNWATRATDPDDNFWLAHYEESITYPATGVLGDGTRVTVTDRRGKLWDIKTDLKRSVAVRFIDPLHPNNPAFREFDSYRNMTKFIDKRGNETVYTYQNNNNQMLNPAQDNLLSIDPPLVPATNYTYIGGSNPILQNRLETVTLPPVNGNSATMQYQYTPAGNMKRVDYSDGSYETVSYITYGRPEIQRDRNGNQMKFVYGNTGGQDPFNTGLAIEVLLPDPQNPAGSPFSTENKTKFFYDVMGNTIKTLNPMGDGVSSAYDALYRPISATEINTTGALVAASKVEVFYDLNSNLAKQIGAQSENAAGQTIRQTSRFRYDKQDRLILSGNHYWSGNLNDGEHAMRYEYDANGNLTKTFDERELQISEYVYDDMNRLDVSIAKGGQTLPGTNLADSPESKSKFEYDNDSNLIQVTLGYQGANPIVSRKHYDALNRRVVSQNQAIGSISVFEYDENSMLKKSNHNRLTGFFSLWTPGTPVSDSIVTLMEYDPENLRLSHLCRVNTVGNPGSGPNHMNGLDDSYFSYDDAGNMTALKDDNEHEGRREFNALNQVRAVESARRAQNGQLLGPKSQIVFETDGLTQKHNVDNPGKDGIFGQGDARVDAQTLLRDNRRRPTSGVDARGEEVAYEYDDAGNVVSTTDQGGFIVIFTYDELYRLVKTEQFKDPNVTNGDSIVTSYFYDQSGHLLSMNVGAADSHRSDFVYDTQSRQIASYEHPGNPFAPNNPPASAGPLKKNLFDDRGFLVKNIDEDGHVIILAYDAGGRLISKDFRWDDNNQPNSLRHKVHLEYDFASNLISTYEESGTSGMNYLPQTGDMAQEFVWDDLGRKANEYWLIYNGTLFVGFKSVALTHDDKGLRRKLTHPDSAMLDVSYFYNEDDQIRELRGNPDAPQAQWMMFTNSYGKSGACVNSAMSNGTVTDRAYTERGETRRLRSLKAGGQKTSADFSYVYNSRMQRQSAFWAHLGVSEHFDYSGWGFNESDSISGNAGGTAPANTFVTNTGNPFESSGIQISEERQNPPAVHDRSCVLLFDEAGNRESCDLLNSAPGSEESGLTEYDHDGQNRMTGISFDSLLGPNFDYTVTFAYNEQGQLGTKTTNYPVSGRVIVESYGYGYLDRLTSYARSDSQNPSVSFMYSYTPMGQRLCKKNMTTNEAECYFCDGQDVLAAYDLTLPAVYNLKEGYYGALNMDSKVSQVNFADFNGNPNDYQLLYYINDALGSVHRVEDQGTPGSAPNTLSTSLTDAWGKTIFEQGSSGIRYGFAQREKDAESGLMYYRNRMYDPATGRFTQKDPLGMPDGPNRYAYCNNDPVNCTDPMGLVGIETAMLFGNVMQGFASYNFNRLLGQASIETYLTLSKDERGQVRRAWGKVACDEFNAHGRSALFQSLTKSFSNLDQMDYYLDGPENILDVRMLKTTLEDRLKKEEELIKKARQGKGCVTFNVDPVTGMRENLTFHLETDPLIKLLGRQKATFVANLVTSPVTGTFEDYGNAVDMIKYDDSWYAIPLGITAIAAYTICLIPDPSDAGQARHVVNEAEVLLDTNAVLTHGADYLKSGKKVVKAGVTEIELANGVAKGKYKMPRASDLIESVAHSNNVDLRINVRSLLTPKRRGNFADGIIGATAIERGSVLVTNDKSLIKAIKDLGGKAQRP